MGNSDGGANRKGLFGCSDEMAKYQCTACPSFQTNFLTSLKCHIRDGHKMEDSAEDIYKCMKCLFVSYSEYVMGRHSFFSECATRDKAERMKQFVRFSGCQAYLNLKLEDKQETLFHNECGETDRFKCGPFATELRGESDQKRPNIIGHPTSRKMNLPYQGKCSVIQHIETGNSNSEDIRLFTCDYCPSKFTQKYNLQTHITLNHPICEPIKWFMCDYCPSKFKQKQCVKQHIIFRHTKLEDIKWFVCEYCTAKFKNKGSLRRHVTCLHSKPEDIKWFPCDKCAFKCKQKPHLLRHITSRHTNPEDIPWYTCDNCPLKFKQKTHLQRHITSRHAKPEDIKWFPCDKCPSKFKRKQHLQKHITRIHSKSEDMQ